MRTEIKQIKTQFRDVEVEWTPQVFVICTTVMQQVSGYVIHQKAIEAITSTTFFLWIASWRI